MDKGRDPEVFAGGGTSKWTGGRTEGTEVLGCQFAC